MLTILFAILMLGIFGKLFSFSLHAAWGITKILFYIVFLPIILIGIFIAGLIYIAFPLLIIIGIIVLIRTVING